MRKAIATLMLFGLPSATACFDGNQGSCASYYVNLDGGTLVDGINPVTWLDPYWGTHTGTLTWATGGQTAVVMTTAPVQTQPVTGQCNGGRITQVDGDALVTFMSADGGLNLSVQGGVGGPYPAAPDDTPVPSAVGTDGIPLPPPGELAAHLAIDLTRYSAAESYFTFSIDWPEGTSKPQSAALEFVGYPLQAPGSMDQVLVASIAFP